jgi:hypothetical protein
MKDTHNVEQLYDNILQMNEQEYIIKNLINIFNSDSINVLMIAPYIMCYTKLEVSRKEWENFLIKKFFNISRTEFIENFFKQNNILAEYYVNLKNAKRTINHMQLLGLVSGSFTWTTTPQGHSFWCKVHEDFNKYVYENINKKYE